MGLKVKYIVYWHSKNVLSIAVESAATVLKITFIPNKLFIDHIIPWSKIKYDEY